MANPLQCSTAVTTLRRKRSPSGLAAELGFDPIDAGPLENARLLEPVAMLWIWLALKGGLTREIAFKLVPRSS